METIKLNRTGRIILAIVICFIIVYIIFIIRSSKQGETEETTFSKLAKRLEELKKEIEDEMKSLNLTEQMKRFLENKINRYFMLAKCTFIGVFLTIAGLFYSTGLDVLASLLSSVGVVSFVCVALSFVLVNKFMEANNIIKFIQRLIRNWIYKKYSFHPSVITIIKDRIQAKQNEYNEINKKIEVAYDYTTPSTILISSSVSP